MHGDLDGSDQRHTRRFTVLSIPALYRTRNSQSSGRQDPSRSVRCRLVTAMSTYQNGMRHGSGTRRRSGATVAASRIQRVRR